MGHTESAKKGIEMNMLDTLSKASGIDAYNPREMTNTLLTFGSVTGDYVHERNINKLTSPLDLSGRVQHRTAVVGDHGRQGAQRPAEGADRAVPHRRQFTASRQEQIRR